MSTPLAWIIVMAFAVGAVYRGMKFRRGSDRSLMRIYLATSQPATFRNLPLLTPFVGACVVAILLAGGILAWAVEANPGPPTALDVILATGLGGSIFWLFGSAIVLAYRPPRWLVPSWLVDEDYQSGRLPPKPGWSDRLYLLIAVASFALGVLLLGYGIVTVLGRS